MPTAVQALWELSLHRSFCEVGKMVSSLFVKYQGISSVSTPKEKQNF